MARADGVYGEYQRALRGVPNGECPVSNELAKAIRAPFFIRRGNKGNIGGVDGQ